MMHELANFNFENVCADGRIILKYIFQKFDGEKGWIDLV
jgi:hypothetical protein